jgi:hypothetical protein
MFSAVADATNACEVQKLLSTYKEAQTFINTPLIVEKGLRQNGREEDLTGKQIDDYFVIVRKSGTPLRKPTSRACAPH